MSAGTTTSQQRPPLWRDVRVLRVVGQAAFAVATIAFFYFLYGNLTTNFGQRNIPTGFGYINQPGGFTVQFSDISSSTPIWRVLLLGVKNTLIVSGVGIVLTTILGVLLGVARLSTNWLVRKGAALYVETVRNIPVLVWIFFFFFAIVLQVLPPIQDAVESPGRYVLSNEAVYLPSFVTPEGGAGRLAMFAGIGLVAALAVAWWRTRRNERTGEPHHRVLWGFGTFLVVAGVAYVVAGIPIEVSGPVRERFAVEGGFALSGTFLGLLIALVVYTSSHVAEIVRGSILAVPKGQTEAAKAVALTGFQRTRHVVLPQALRVMVPPLANQYLNLTKNSSLAVAIGYFDIMQAGKQVISNGRPAVQTLAIIMVIYLIISLAISFLTNLYNRSIQYVNQ